MRIEDDNFPPFTLDELEKEIKQLKRNKVAGIDGILNEFLKHLGPKAQQWLLLLFTSCLRTKKISKKWRKTKVAALLKPNKDPTNPKSYSPISLLWTLYKLYERLVLNRYLIQLAISSHQTKLGSGQDALAAARSLT